MLTLERGLGINEHQSIVIIPYFHLQMLSLTLEIREKDMVIFLKIITIF